MGGCPTGCGSLPAVLLIGEQADGNRDDFYFPGGLCWIAFGHQTRSFDGASQTPQNSQWIQSANARFISKQPSSKTFRDLL